jgi:uncharacterized glyoxalase superfamily protein PhnB
MNRIKRKKARRAIAVALCAIVCFATRLSHSQNPTPGEKQMKFNKLTPNLFVHDVQASMKFYESVLGFQKAMTVPEQPPYVFGAVTNGNVEIFFNDLKAVAEENPQLGNSKIGGTLTLYIEVEGIEQVLQAVERSGAKVNMPLKTQFYGMREFGFIDPEGWMVTIAERVK